MAILQNLRTVPVRRGWLAREQIDEGLGLVQLYPGAMMVDLVAYIGYRVRGVAGTLVATTGFVRPALVLMLALSWLYTSYGAAPGMAQFVVGLDAIVVGVIASVAVDFALQYAVGRLPALFALAGFALVVSGANVLWPVLGGLFVGAVALRPAAPVGAAVATADAPALAWNRLAVACLPGAAVVAAVAPATLGSGALSTLALDMAKVGSVAFGNGSTIMPVLQQDVVNGRHWLTLPEFGAAIGFGQITPGPFLITATFVGYRVAGLWGGVLATVAIFAPSVAMTTVAAELYPLLRRLVWVRGAIAGIMAVFVGLLASVALSLGRPLAASSAALVLLASAFVALRVAKWNLLVIFGAGLGAWALYLVLGGTG